MPIIITFFNIFIFLLFRCLPTPSTKSPIYLERDQHHSFKNLQTLVSTIPESSTKSSEVAALQPDNVLLTKQIDQSMNNKAYHANGFRSLFGGNEITISSTSSSFSNEQEADLDDKLDHASNIEIQLTLKPHFPTPTSQLRKVDIKEFLEASKGAARIFGKFA